MSSRESHNLTQSDYFSRAVKPTMVPARTPYIERQVDRLLDFAAISKTDSVLEVGCGMGRYTLPLAERGIRVTGLDLTPFLLEKLAEFAEDRYSIPTICSDVIEHPPELREKFDAVVGFFTLHHFFDIDQAYAAMSRLVRPGGVIAFLEPNAFNPLYYLQVTFTPGMTWEGDRGIVEMREGRIFRAMRRAGLELLEAERFGFFPPFIYNRPLGQRLDHLLERLVWNRVLPFQIFKGRRPSER